MGCGGGCGGGNTNQALSNFQNSRKAAQNRSVNKSQFTKPAFSKSKSGMTAASFVNQRRAAARRA